MREFFELVQINNLSEYSGEALERVDDPVDQRAQLSRCLLHGRVFHELVRVDLR